jgi:A118 family predicted phage portal protein
MLNQSSVKSAMRVDVAITPNMAEALQKWALIYENRSPWLNSDIKSLNLGAAIAVEVARAVTLEMEVSLSGSPRADFLAAQMKPALAFIRSATEYAAAKGGLVFKPYISGGTLAVDFVQADQFYPTAFDSNGNMTACVFADQKVIGSSYYTRMEYHALTAEGYKIQNRAFKSTTRDMLGHEVQLAEVSQWADLQPEALIQNVTRPLFAYFKMPFANNIDVTSPLGISCFSRAVDLIEQADKIWSELLWEFESGHRVLYADAQAFAKETTTGLPVLPNKRLYRALNMGAGKSIDAPAFFHDWTPTLREQNILSGLDAVLKKIEFNCGLAQGTISDPATVALTATEIKMSRQRTYATITDAQKSLQNALDGLLYAMDVWATLGDLAPRGTYTANYHFDDSIVADHDTQFSQDTQAMGLGVMSKIEWRMRQYGEDEATAKKMVAMAEAEKSAAGEFFQ